MTPEQEQAEREHCERAVYEMPQGMLSKADWLLRERAAVRAESERRITELEKAVAFERECHLRAQQDFCELQSKHGALVAAAQDAATQLQVLGRPDFAARLDAALAGEPPTTNWRERYEALTEASVTDSQQIEQLEKEIERLCVELEKNK